MGAIFHHRRWPGRAIYKGTLCCSFSPYMINFRPQTCNPFGQRLGSRLRLVPGQRARAISAMFVTVGNVYCFNCPRLSWRAGSSRFDPWRWAKRIAAWGTRMCIVLPHQSRPITAQVRKAMTPDSTSQQYQGLFKQTRPTLTPPPNDAIIWTERSYLSYSSWCGSSRSQTVTVSATLSGWRITL